MKRFLLLLIVLITTNTLFATQQINGYVRDAESGEALIGATIADQNFRTGTATNAYGYFSLNISDSVKSITISFVGYETQNLEIENNKILNIKLSPTSDEISEIEVVRSAPARLSMERLSARTITKLPVVLGESDITRTIQMLPGVTPGTEATSGYFVRGGDADQNLLLIDGTPIYNAYHMFGLFSVFNSDAVNDARFYKGSIPVSYGGSLSSVMDISMREGNAERFSGEIGIGTFTSKILLEGPIIKDRTSFLLTARRSMLDKSPEFWRDFVLDISGVKEAKSQQQESQNVNIDKYYYGDVNIKLNHQFSERSRLFVSYYKGKDKNEDESEDSFFNNTNNFFEFTNQSLSMRYNQILSNNLYADLIVYNSKYDYKNMRLNLLDSSYLSSTSGINDYSAKLNFSQTCQNHNLAYGIQWNLQKINPSVTSYNDTIIKVDTTLNFDYDFKNIGIYLSDKIQLTEKLDATIGIRGDIAIAESRNYIELQPRVLVNYRLPMNVTAKASYSRTAQNLHKLSLTSNGAPSDMWVATTDNYCPSTADEVVLGFGIPFFGNRFLFTIEGFYKQMHDLLIYSEGVSYNAGYTDWQQMVESGKGKSQGAEFCLKKEHGKTSGWISYTLSKSTREFDNINLGREFPFTFDRRHNIAVAVMQEIGKNWEIGSNWIYMTGNAITLPNIYYKNGINGISPSYNSKNSSRMPATHRLDMCLNYSKELKYCDFKFGFGVYNVYARNNPYYVIEDKNTIGKYNIVSLFEIVPYLTLGLKF